MTQKKKKKVKLELKVETSKQKLTTPLLKDTQNLFELKEKWYVHNIFTTNHGWLVVIGRNLNLILRLLF